MESPNRMALDLVDEAIDFADELRVGVHHLDNDATVLDFGVDVAGGFEAGLLLAEVATGGLATVGTRVGTVGGATLTHVELATDHPALALADCQRPVWPVDLGGATRRVGGPGQLLRDGADRRDDDAEFAILTIEADHLPETAAIGSLASAVGLAPSAVFVAVAPANSIAGGVAHAARAAERAVARLDAVGYDLDAVRSMSASAPVAPIPPTAGEARARSIAAIAGGGRVHLVLEEPVERPDELVDAPGDAAVPAQLTIDVVGGDAHSVGGIDQERLADDLGL